MNVRKFIAENSRLAMRLAKQELGDDAVILSSRQASEGFEIMAIAHRDMASLDSAGASTGGTSTAGARASRAGGQGGQGGQSGHAQPGRQSAVEPQSFVDFARKWKDKGHANASVSASPAATLASSVKRPAIAVMAQRDEPPAEDLMAEIKSMRSVMEAQLASLAWSDSARRAPLKTKLASQMLGAGFSPGLCRAIAARLPDDYTQVQAESWLVSIIEANVRKSAQDELINKGGVYALVGPTGVGKTTTTAKLAARYVMKHGAQRLGLISADSYRIGAQDQLRIYGRILGVPVHAVQDAEELHATLAAMRDKHLVLIDTIGVGQRDARVAEQVAMLGAPGIKRLLLLNAACQAETLEDVVRAYAGSGESSLAGCCISKLDEAVKPGSVIDTAIRHKLPLHFVSTGQRVPEDLHLPNVSFLVHRALKSVTGEQFRLSPDEVGLLLAPRFLEPRAEHAGAC